MAEPNLKMHGAYTQENVLTYIYIVVRTTCNKVAVFRTAVSGPNTCLRIEIDSTT